MKNEKKLHINSLAIIRLQSASQPECVYHIMWGVIHAIHWQHSKHAAVMNMCWSFWVKLLMETSTNYFQQAGVINSWSRFLMWPTAYVDGLLYILTVGIYMDRSTSYIYQLWIIDADITNQTFTECLIVQLLLVRRPLIIWHGLGRLMTYVWHTYAIGSIDMHDHQHALHRTTTAHKLLELGALLKLLKDFLQALGQAGFTHQSVQCYGGFRCTI